MSEAIDVPLLRGDRNPHLYCLVDYCGVLLVYARVWKGGNNQICSRMISTDGNPFPARWCAQHPCLFFSFVREPLSHFISGYSEVQWRLRDATATTPADFIRGVLAGGMRCHECAHTLPLVSLLARPSDAPLDFVGRLDALPGDWDVRLRARVLELRPAHGACAAGAPPDETLAAPAGGTRPTFPWGDSNSTHPGSDAASGYAPREAMEALLLRSADRAHLRAMCRVLLPDYACFGYPLPAACAEGTGLDRVVERMRPHCGALLEMRPGSLTPLPARTASSSSTAPRKLMMM